MNTSREGGYGHWVVVLIGLTLVLFLVGFFRTDQPISQVTYKKIMMLPCGLTVKAIEDNDKITFPFKMFGYINECGWIRKGQIAGTAQVFDGKGLPVSNKVNLNIPEDNTGYPYYFENTLLLEHAPTTDTGSLIINGVGGLNRAIQVSFLR